MALRLLARPLAQQLLVPRLVPGSTRLLSKRHRGNGQSIQDSRQDRAPASSQSGHPSPSPTPDEAPVEPPATAPPPLESEQFGPARTEPATAEPTAEPQVVSLPSLDFAPGEQPRTGARPRGAPSQTPGQRLASRLLTFALVAGAGATIWHLGRDWEEEELKKRRKEPLPTGTGFWAFWQRVKTRAMAVTGLFSEPAWEDLLPPPLPPPHQKPYTLLLSIDDLLVTSTWDRQHGWRTAKRPGVDYFLGYLSQFYEIVIFTSQPFYHAGPISEKLDPYQFYVMYRLFREATRFVDGQVVKDISFLNRDLSKVIALDTHPEHYALQPENALIVPPWTGEPGDKGLVALIPFLESIAIYKPQDVRPILKKYAGKDVAVEYAKQEAEHKRAFLEDWRAKNAGRAMPGAGFSSGGFTLSSLFGGSGPSLPHGPEPMTYLEQKRAEAQRNYLDEQAYLKQNEGEIKRMIEEDLKERERLAKEQGGSIFAMMGALMHGPPGLPAPGPAQTQATAEAAGKK